jgi:hypothetical protein
MSKLNYIELQTYLREKVTDTAIYKKAVSIALGVAIARLLPLPSTCVEDASLHFATAVKQTANTFICEFNEAIVVDVDLVSQTVLSHWMIRYTCAYPDCSMPILSMGDFGFIAKINNVNRFINPETYKLCECNSELMVVLVNRITSVLNQTVFK